MTTISYLGGSVALHHEDEADVYNSVDHETGDTFHLAVGDEVDVSKEKASQLADDHPGCFKIDDKVAGQRPKQSTQKPDGDLREKLLAHSRDELNAAAVELGVDTPEALPNKAAVADAIVAAKADQ